jgi:hypothetical protein
MVSRIQRFDGFSRLDGFDGFDRCGRFSGFQINGERLLETDYGGKRNCKNCVMATSFDYWAFNRKNRVPAGEVRFR